ncbi:hypothetical protein AbraIFM66951_000491 [Aspergillus brasiliensis]|nr:hypothetical protein AbraIFM66951_000491 [Aspergillus brasiliensis]
MLLNIATVILGTVISDFRTTIIGDESIHLLGLPDQREVIKRIVTLSKPGTMVVDFQQGRKQPCAEPRLVCRATAKGTEIAKKALEEVDA